MTEEQPEYNYTTRYEYSIPHNMTPEEWQRFQEDESQRRIERQKAEEAKREHWIAFANNHSQPELIHKLIGLIGGDPESIHGDADDILIALIGDPTIKEIYDDIEKWYA